MNDLLYIRDIPWKEIWNTWKTTEEESWREYYTEKGFATWESWRNKYLDIIHPESRTWKLYNIQDPLLSVPECFVGPFLGWKQYYDDRAHSRYKDIAKHPKIKENGKIAKMLADYPEEVLFIGLQGNNKTMFIEGTHRAVALSILSDEVRDVETNAMVAMTEFSKDEQDTFEKIFSQINRVPKE